MYPRRRIKVPGFTLIELLIVILIISIVSSVALLSIGHNEKKQIETFANDLAQAMQLAQEQALLEPTVIGFSTQNQQFEFLRYARAEESKKSWRNMEEPPFHSQYIPKNLSLSVKTQNQEKLEKEDEGLPQIIFSPNGNITPFTIYLGKFAKTPAYKITGEADGKITVTSMS